MLVKLNVEAQEDLKLLKDLDPEHVEQFCKLAIDFVKGTSNASQQQQQQQQRKQSDVDDVRASLHRISGIAANKLQRDRETIERSIQSLAYLFISTSKADLSVEEFQFSLFDLGLSERTMQLLESTYSGEREELRWLLSTGTRASDIVTADAVDESAVYSMERDGEPKRSVRRELMLGENRYKDLRWRLDLEVDSRMVRHHMPKARYLVQLDTTTKGTQFFQAEYQDLVHMCSTLETALRELNSVNVRRVKTYIK